MAFFPILRLGSIYKLVNIYLNFLEEGKYG